MASAPVSETLGRLGASLLALGRIRLELFALDFQEEKERLAALLFWSVLSALLGGLALVFVALTVTVALWDSHRLAALLACSAVFVAGLLFGLWRLRRLGDAPGPFATSLAELRADEQGLRDRAAP